MIANESGGHYVEQVRPEWTDHNGHLNVAYFGLILDRATDHLFSRFGLGPEYMEARACSTFAVESYTRYFAEVLEGQEVGVSSWVFDVDDKRVRYGHEMRRLHDGVVAATFEQISLHIDMTARKVCPWPDDIRRRLAGGAGMRAGFDKLDIQALRRSKI